MVEARVLQSTSGARARHLGRRLGRHPALAAALVLMLGGLPAAALAQGGSRSADLAKREQTLATMKQLIDAMFGTGDSAGYIADMGQQPTSLSDLTAAAGSSPAYSVANLGGVGMGYGGPYLPRPGNASATFVDGWGSPIALLSTATTIQLRSSGPDRDAATTADNLLYPLTPRVTHGIVEVEVISRLADGTAPVTETASTVAVSVYLPSSGAQTSMAGSWVAGVSGFQGSGVPVGRHYVTATALDGAQYTVSSSFDVAELRGSKALVRLRLTRAAAAPPPAPPAAPPAAPPPALDCGSDTLICHKPSGVRKQMCMHGSSLAAHLGHGDTLGNCP